LSGPLNQFQTTEFEKEDFKKLIQVINNKLDDNKLASIVLDSVFDKWWPELERDIKKCMAEIGEENIEPVRTDRDVLNEILELSRMATRNIPAAPQRIKINPQALIHLLETFITIHNENCAGVGGYQETLDRLKEMSKAIIYLGLNYSGNNAKAVELVQKVQKLAFLYEKKEQMPSPSEGDIPF
jgi:hypothetical protein